MKHKTVKQVLMGISDEENLKNELSFIGIFIAIYENFVDLTVDRVKYHYCTGFTVDDNGSSSMIFSPDYDYYNN